jgi:hypothetical protein
MGEIKELTSFYESIRDDPRIGTTHISLYMALFQLYNLNGFRNPINICRKKVMEVAKISGLATFHKCIKHLNEFGYIRYKPSYDPRVGSEVYFPCSLS